MRSATNNSRPIVRALALCAGSGSRTGLSYNKILHAVGQKCVLEMTLDSLCRTGADSITLVISPRDEERVREIVAPYENVSLCYGGGTRTESARLGLNSLSPCDIVIIQDGARPFTDEKVFAASVDSALAYGSGIAAVPVSDTVRMNSNGKCQMLPREQLYALQTPQTFRFEEILAAYNGFDGTATDDSAVYEAAGYCPRLVSGSAANRKITTKEDLYFLSGDLRVGVGFDVHELVEGRKLILGGVHIPYPLGLKGHSDADVLAHAVMDALLSAAGKPDIGVLFPDSDPKFEGADSMKLLETVAGMIEAEGFEICNLSAVVMAQKPKLAPVISEIRRSLSCALKVDFALVNVSATTTEHLGIVGKEQGMAASATALIRKKTEADE